MITAIGGWGGIKFELVNAGMTATFAANRAYCEQPDFIPEGWSKQTANRKDISQIDGFRVKLSCFMENVSADDYLNIEELIQIINVHAATGEAIRIYPKWNDSIPSSIFYECKLAEGWKLADIVQKRNVAQKVPVQFESVEQLSEIPIYEDTDPVFALGTSDGKLLVANRGE